MYLAANMMMYLAANMMRASRDGGTRCGTSYVELCDFQGEDPVDYCQEWEALVPQGLDTARCCTVLRWTDWNSVGFVVVRSFTKG